MPIWDKLQARLSKFDLPQHARGVYAKSNLWVKGKDGNYLKCFDRAVPIYLMIEKICFYAANLISMFIPC